MPETQSQASVSWNDQLWIGRTVAEVLSWSQVHGVEEVGMPDRVPEDLDVTHQQSPDGQREIMPGLMPVADLSQDLQFWPTHASQVLLDELAGLTEAGTPEFVQVAMVVGGMQRTYRAYVNSFVPGGTVGDKRMASLTCKIFERILPNPVLSEA